MITDDPRIGKQFLHEYMNISNSASNLAREIEKSRADGSWYKKTESERLDILAKMFVLGTLEHRIERALNTFNEFNSAMLESLILEIDEEAPKIPEEFEKEAIDALCRFTCRLFAT